jgi:Mg-chelatase subunit ChlD
VSIRSRFLASLALCVVLAAPLLADTRKDNIDVVIALDKSLSMEHKVNAVKDWVNSFIIDQLLIPGDTFVVIAFYGKAELLINQTIQSEAAKIPLKKLISQIRGNGKFTDIGNALDTVKEQLAKRESDGREKYVLLLTDGIQEAPPSSKYWSKDGSFNHAFLSNTKTIQQKGWKVMILGIGTDTAAKDLARELQGSYNEITNKLTPDTITQNAGQLFGGITAEGMRVEPVAGNGSSRLTMTLKASGLQGDAEVTVSGITAKVGGLDIANILPQPQTITVKKDASVNAAVPLRFPAGLPQGSGPATLLFSFSSKATFSPSEASLPVTVNGFIMNNLTWLIPALVVALLIVVFLIVLIWRLTAGKPLHFSVLIDDEPVGDGISTLSGKHELFLNESDKVFSLMQRRNQKSFARFSVKDRKLLLTVLKQDRFPKVKEVPPDVRGRSFPMKAENGKAMTMKVQSKDRK